MFYQREVEKPVKKQLQPEVGLGSKGHRLIGPEDRSISAVSNPTEKKTEKGLSDLPTIILIKNSFYYILDRDEQQRECSRMRKQHMTRLGGKWAQYMLVELKKSSVWLMLRGLVEEINVRDYPGTTTREQ